MTHYLLACPVILREGIGFSQIVGPEGILFTTEVAIRPDQRMGGLFALEPDGVTLQVDFQAVVQAVRVLPEPGVIMVYPPFKQLALVAGPPPRQAISGDGRRRSGSAPR